MKRTEDVLQKVSEICKKKDIKLIIKWRKLEKI